MTNIVTDQYSLVRTTIISDILPFTYQAKKHIEGFSREIFRNGQHLYSINTINKIQRVKNGDVLLDINLGIHAISIRGKVSTRDEVAISYELVINVQVCESKKFAVAYLQSADPVNQAQMIFKSALTWEIQSRSYVNATPNELRLILEHQIAQDAFIRLKHDFGIEISYLQQLDIKIDQESDSYRLQKEIERDRITQEYMSEQRSREQLSQILLDEQSNQLKRLLAQGFSISEIIQVNPELSKVIRLFYSETANDIFKANVTLPSHEKKGVFSVFISHSHEDNTWCRQFVDALKALGCDIWYDEAGLQGGTAWIETIESEIQSRKNFVVVLTPESLSSTWVKRELQLAYATNRFIIPVILRPVQLDGFMMTLQWILVRNEDVDNVVQKVISAFQE